MESHVFPCEQRALQMYRPEVLFRFVFSEYCLVFLSLYFHGYLSLFLLVGGHFCLLISRSYRSFVVFVSRQSSQQDICLYLHLFRFNCFCIIILDRISLHESEFFAGKRLETSSRDRRITGFRFTQLLFRTHT